VKGLVTLGILAGAGAALYRRAQQIAEDEGRALADVASDLPGRIWNDLRTIPDDLRAAADEGMSAARRAADRVDQEDPD
jgi:sugar lactone lactonase YvrE